MMLSTTSEVLDKIKKEGREQIMFSSSQEMLQQGGTERRVTNKNGFSLDLRKKYSITKSKTELKLYSLILA